MADPPKVDPLQVVREFMEAHQSIADLRLHVLLWFNAFESVMLTILAWRLSCSERLPRLNSRTLFELVLADQPHLSKHCDLLCKVRNKIAHRFHQPDYDDDLQAFCKGLDAPAWPDDEKQKAQAFTFAIRHLAIQIAFEVAIVGERPSFPVLPGSPWVTA